MIEGSDHEYTFTPPKTAELVLPMLDDDADDMAAAKAAFSWLEEGMSKADAAHLLSRLQDKEDDLDFEILQDVVEGLTEKVAGRPTT